jgi:pimeloyl-ACP methyl ester carboxylesterase
MPVKQINGIEIYYEITGSGEPLLLIAGVGYGCWFWRKLVSELETDFQVITFDNRGSGQTAKPEGPYTVPMLTADTAGLLDALELEKVNVLGHSLGGFVAQELAVSRPELVGRLILASTNHGGMKVVPITPEALEVMTNREGDPVELVKRGIGIACAPGFTDAHPDVVKELIDYRFTNPVPPAQYQAQVAAGAATAAYTDEEVNERMASIQVPTLILSGEHDRVVPPGNAQLMAEKIANARVVLIPGTGHIFPIENPGAAAGTIREFLAGT